MLSIISSAIRTLVFPILGTMKDMNVPANFPQTAGSQNPQITKKQIMRWRNHLADERAEAATYRDLASRRTGEERDILLALAEAEKRHEDHWRSLLGEHEGKPLRGSKRTRALGFLARRFGGVFVLALAQQAELRTGYLEEQDASEQMRADERIHGEVVRGLATRGRQRMSGTFRAAVFGANDGLVSNLALILGIGASGASNSIIILTGAAGLLAGALSMGAGEFVSIKSQLELLDAESPAPEASAAIAHLDVDENELALVYRARGMGEEEANEHAAQMIESFGEHTQIAESVDMEQHESVGTAWGAAISSFFFFASGAIIPLLPYIFGATGFLAVVISAALVGLALLGTGATVGILSGASPMRRALRQLAIGYGAAAATYVLGWLFGVSGI